MFCGWDFDLRPRLSRFQQRTCFWWLKRRILGGVSKLTRRVCYDNRNKYISEILHTNRATLEDVGNLCKVSTRVNIDINQEKSIEVYESLLEI